MSLSETGPKRSDGLYNICLAEVWCRTYTSSDWVIIYSINGFAPNKRPVINGANADLLSTEPPGTNFIYTDNRFYQEDEFGNVVLKIKRYTVKSLI